MTTVKERIFEFFGVVPEPQETYKGTALEIKDVIMGTLNKCLYEPIDRILYHKIQDDIRNGLNSLQANNYYIENWYIDYDELTTIEVSVYYSEPYERVFFCDIECAGSGITVNCDDQEVKK